MMTGKRPADNMFQEGLDLHKIARMVVPDQVTTIVDPPLLNDDRRRVDNNEGQLQATKSHIMECLISMDKIGVASSMESPEDGMDIHNVIKELQSIKRKFVGARANPSVH